MPINTIRTIEIDGSIGMELLPGANNNGLAEVDRDPNSGYSNSLAVTIAHNHYLDG